MTTTNVPLSVTPLPEALQPLAEQLRDAPNVSNDEMMSILFVVRLVNALHRSNYASFLSSSLVDELTQDLGLKLDLEIGVFFTNWTYKGAVAKYRISFDYDARAMHELSRIGQLVLDHRVTLQRGLVLIKECEAEKDVFAFERFYRTFPGRILVIPFLSSTAAVCFFDGTAVDFGIAWVAGLAAGFLHYLCTAFTQLASIQDFLVSICTALIAIAGSSIFPEQTCVSAVILGTFFWFYYGIAFVLSLYEITEHHLLVTGLTRFGLALFNSFILGFGTSIGIWMTGNANDLEEQDCTGLEPRINRYWLILLYPILGACAMMQLRTSPKHWLVCMVVQFVGVGSQYVLQDVWDQPIFVANFVPALLCTWTAHILIIASSYYLDSPKLVIRREAYLLKKFDDIQGRLTPPPLSTTQFTFESTGWADNVAASRKGMMSGYFRNKQNHYQRGDLWFCFLPALYLLVPGSNVFRLAFFSIVNTIQVHSDEGDISETEAEEVGDQYYVSTVVVLGMALVLGVRLGIVVLWLLNKLVSFLSCGKREQENELPLQRDSMSSGSAEVVLEHIHVHWKGDREATTSNVQRKEVIGSDVENGHVDAEQRDLHNSSRSSSDGRSDTLYVPEFHHSDPPFASGSSDMFSPPDSPRSNSSTTSGKSASVSQAMMFKSVERPTSLSATCRARSHG